MDVGIELMNVFGGVACLDVQMLAKHRALDTARFDKLLMREKAVALPYEDPITFGVNAAKPIMDSLSESERNRIELLVTCSESGIDFGKSISTYIHHYLGLSRNCRLFEIKQACYSGTAGLQMAVNFVLSQTSPGAKALVIATDIFRFIFASDGRADNGGWSYAEPSSGAGAVAALVSAEPKVFQMDVGASGYYGYEVMDTCRPVPDGDAGDADLSLLSYLDCCEQSFAEYKQRVVDADYKATFNYLAFHTPFGGMVKGAHRTMMRKLVGASPTEIERDFELRVAPGLIYCQSVGNIMGGTVLLSLASTIDKGEFSSPRRIGCFSYGSGCCSEFYSGIVRREGQIAQRRLAIGKKLSQRFVLSLEDYESVLKSGSNVRFGTRNVVVDHQVVPGARASCNGREILLLREIKDFHRKYEWTS
jgi:polyketide biosynthesis 3-hydroxy-3-methylglutaryl-CoA synthase-like enzyme PksG